MAVTRIRISFFKPTGFMDTHYVNTDDRGLAARTVMARYGREMKCLNTLEAALGKAPEGVEVLEPAGA